MSDKIVISKTDYNQLMQNTELLQKYNDENIKLKQINLDYEKRLSDLESALKKTQEQSKSMEIEPNDAEFSTDEEELEKEFNQQSKQQSKKRRRKDKETPPKTNTSKETEPKIKISKPPLPPPINVSNVINFNQFREKIVEAVSSAQFKATSANDIKITVLNEDEYRKVKKLLEEQSTTAGGFPDLVYHTYQLKSEKSFRAVIRGLPPSCEVQEIADELKELGHEPTKTSNIIKKIKDKEGNIIIKKFPLFLVDMNQKENNKEIFNIKNLLHCKVTVEAPKQVRGIPQCINCQQLGHTKNFCTREAICVKCAGKHSTKLCTKRPNVTPKCALCQHDGHTANYKGCPIYQKRIKSQNQQPKSAVNRLREEKLETKSTINPSNSGISYAQVTKNSINESQKNQKKQANEPSLSEILKLLTELKTDIDRNIGQLSNRLAKLETKPSAKNTKSQKHRK